MTNSDNMIEMQGIVEKHVHGKFDVKLTENNKTVLCTISGKLRVNNIKIIVGDLVTVRISVYDLNKGIIVWRG